MDTAMSTQLTLLTQKNTGDDVRGSLKIAITFFSRRHITMYIKNWTTNTVDLKWTFLNMG